MISKRIRNIAASLFMALGLVMLPVAYGGVVMAANKDNVCEGIAAIDGGNACAPDSTAGNALGNFLGRIVNILLFIIGAIAVIMIIIGGIRYVTSNGDSAQTSSAKNTILYAVVGVVVAIMAYAIINFVLKSI